MKTYRDLELWQRAMDLVLECYQATKSFPKSETFGLGSQMQRAVVSIPANIAEGHGRQHRAEFIQHLFIAHGSLAELETHIEIAQRLRYTSTADAQELLRRAGEVGRLLNGLLRFLRSKPAVGSRTASSRPDTQGSEPKQIVTAYRSPTTANR